jgi:hypothetical protein
MMRMAKSTLQWIMTQTKIKGKQVRIQFQTLPSSSKLVVNLGLLW